MKIPVVIATHNRLELLKQTIDSLKKNSDNEIEIIVVDDASTESGVAKYFDSLENVKFFHFADNFGVARVKNKGIELASPSDYIHICDNDIYYLPHWDIKLIQVLETYEDIGLVGGKRHSHHRIYETRKMLDDEVFILENQPGYSFFMRRELLNEIGGFEVNDPKAFFHADSVMCERVKAKGKLLGAVNPPVIYHCGINNFQGLKASDYPEMQTISQLHPEIKFL